jgi:hypothetical protein
LARTAAVGLDPAYVYGLIRQESRFIMDARSGVGAAGLMQVMPATAKWTAKKLGMTDFAPHKINDRDTNIAIGTGYLKFALDSFGGSMPLAAAAYNAGPSRARQWRSGPFTVEGAIWAENVPFSETRDYVKKVLANTTLYAAITEVNTGRDKIITIEDPVEYELPGVVQVPVNEKKGLTFARGLRSILRNDPDRVMVGEIRDSETAPIAIQAALTGHLVFSTLHANNAIDVLGRFAHMGLDAYDLVSALNGVVAQRLLRLNCTHCTEPVVLTAQQRAHYGLPADGLHSDGADAAAPERFARGRGCPACRGTGYQGRHAVAELFLLDDELRDLIASRAPTGQIKAAARGRGMRSLRDDGQRWVAQGVTSAQELLRVTRD